MCGPPLRSNAVFHSGWTAGPCPCGKGNLDTAKLVASLLVRMGVSGD